MSQPFRLFLVYFASFNEKLKLNCKCPLKETQETSVYILCLRLVGLLVPPRLFLGGDPIFPSSDLFNLMIVSWWVLLKSHITNWLLGMYLGLGQSLTLYSLSTPPTTFQALQDYLER